jgi:hypothetical protein
MSLIPRRFFAFVEGMTNPFAPAPEGAPPSHPIAFIVSNLRPFVGVMVIATFVGLLVALLGLGPI